MCMPNMKQMQNLFNQKKSYLRRYTSFVVGKNIKYYIISKFIFKYGKPHKNHYKIYSIMSIKFIRKLKGIHLTRY